jgi:hypothetical protein
MSRGCRTVCVYSPEPLAGFWEESKYMPRKDGPDAGRGGQAFRLAANVIAYATGKEPPKQRLTQTKIATDTEADRNPPRGALQPVQLQVPGDAPPAPQALRNLMGHLREAAKLDVVIEKQHLPADHPDLFKFKFLYLHGRKRFAFADDEVQNVRANLQAGGLLLADACCGRPEFDAAFRELMGKMFPTQKLTPIPLDDELFSGGLTGTPLAAVRRRDQAGAAGFRDVPPALEGIKVDDRWVVIYSKYDIGCALENHKSTDCLGHDRDSALRIGTAAVLYALKR